MCVCCDARISTIRNTIVFGNSWLVFIISHAHLILFFCCLFALPAPSLLLLRVIVVIRFYCSILGSLFTFAHFRSYFFTRLCLSISISIVSSFTTTAAQTRRISFGKFVFCMILFSLQFSFCFVFSADLAMAKPLESAFIYFFLSLSCSPNTRRHGECNEQTMRSK